MRVYWPWWMLPILIPLWLAWAFVRLFVWLVCAPFRATSSHRDTISVKVSVQEKTPAHPEGQAGEPA